MQMQGPDEEGLQASRYHKMEEAVALRHKISSSVIPKSFILLLSIQRDICKSGFVWQFSPI